MGIRKTVRKETLLGIAEIKACQIEIKGPWAREVGDIKWVRWFVLYQRLNRRQIRKNSHGGK